MISDNQVLVMKVLFFANILWAGVPGLLITIFPKFAQTQILPYMVGSVPQDMMTVRILSSIWLSVGLVSLFGLFNPLPVAAVFVVQIIYKVVWVSVAVLPALLQGETRALPLAVGFVVMIVGFAFATPWAFLLGTEAAA
ncbi:hypothetical protein BH23DEI1_BH23DEI1_16660 [soil metagenome]